MKKTVLATLVGLAAFGMSQVASPEFSTLDQRKRLA